MDLKIVLGGPPRSGKSCLRAGLKAEIRKQGEYIYFITANPDGEGAWFHESYAADAEKANAYKLRYKQSWAAFFEQRVQQYCEAIRNCEETLVGVDVGGQTTPDNREICACASHAILIAGNAGDECWSRRLEPWREMASECGLRVIAELYSDYEGDQDHFESIDNQGVFRGSIHHLERGADLSNRSTIKSLASYVLKLWRTPSPE